MLRGDRDEAEIDLQAKEITKDDAIIIAPLIQSNQSLEVLNLLGHSQRPTEEPIPHNYKKASRHVTPRYITYA